MYVVMVVRHEVIPGTPMCTRKMLSGLVNPMAALYPRNLSHGKKWQKKSSWHRFLYVHDLRDNWSGENQKLIPPDNFVLSISGIEKAG